MRRLLIISLVLCLTTIGLAQVPQNINFQSIIYNTEGGTLPNENIMVRVNILEGSASGDIVYREEHSITTNDFSLVNFKVGTGEVLYGSWDEILWSETDQYLMIEIDASGTGNNFVDMGVARLLSVPYALYANQSTANEMWEYNDNGIHYIDGKVGIGTMHPVEDLELGNERAVLVSSDMPELEDNALIKIQMTTDTSRPNIQWEDLATEEFGASFSTREFSTSPLVLRSNFIISTADENFSRRARIKIKYNETIADMLLINCNLIVNGGFTSGNFGHAITNSFWANQWIHEGYYFGAGNKDWENDGVYPGAAAEFYSNGEGTEILLNSEDYDRYSQIKFRRGNAEWMLRNDSIFSIKRNDQKKIKILNNGNVKIGSSDPDYKLDVYGDINIPVGYSYLIGGGARNSGKYAEYFEIEEPMQMGELAGVNLETGLVKKYESGDMFLGIVCDASGFIANVNSNTTKNSNYALIGLEGLIEFKNQKVKRNNHQLFTMEGQLIGVIIDNQVYLQ